jgi:hypothetical protein
MSTGWGALQQILSWQLSTPRAFEHPYRAGRELFQTLKTGCFRCFRYPKRNLKKPTKSSPDKACALQIDPPPPQVHRINIRFNYGFEETD